MTAANATTMRTFADDDLEARFQRDGFVKVDFADADLVAQLLEAYGELDSGIDSGYYPSLMSPDLEYKAQTHARVRDLLWPRFSQLIVDYSPLLGVFMVKYPGPDTEVPPHRDWIIADETYRPSVTMWMPLTPLTEATGKMRVLPGSNRWLKGLRGSPSFPTEWEAEYQRVRDELMTEVEVGVGQALIYDIRMLHGTPPNLSADTRVVTSLYAIPAGQPPIHYYRAPDGKVVGYEVPENFCTIFNIGDVPNGTPFVEIDDYEVPPLTFDEMAARYAEDRRAVAAPV